MEPPVVPFSPRTRLTRDYTSDDQRPRQNGSGVPVGLPLDFGNPPRGAHGDQRLASSLPVDGVSTSQGSHGTRSPQSRDGSRVGSLDLPRVSHQSDGDNSDELRKLDFNLDVIEERSGQYESSISTVSRASQSTAITSTSGQRLPDFFSAEVFQIVLHNPTVAHQLLKFSRSRLCGENLEFLDKVERYNSLLNQVAKSMFEIHRDYISVNAANQVNIPVNLLVKVNRDLKSALASTLPKLESVFNDTQNEIERLVGQDIYPRFVRHQVTMSAVKALAGERGKYAGLGDCFVLTDPAKADNPIVYLSDGFVKVTGYPRNEIIPRNCRFLQCRHTDPNAVKRLREAINAREEIVELLLNQTKQGEPFWNLLYMTPLVDATGTVVFFLGGQVNCSTTIHNASDVLRILAMSDDTDERAAEGVLSQGAPKPASLTNRLFKTFKTKSNVEPYKEPGMEGKVLNQMERMTLRAQMDTFYTAYSKFIVVNYATFYISFHSSRITSLLHPFKAPPSNLPAQIVGMEIFRYLALHTPGKISSDFKTRVRSAIKAGSAISVDLMLCTRRFMGFEKFGSHWTPLKDEHGEVAFVIVALGSFHD